MRHAHGHTDPEELWVYTLIEIDEFEELNEADDEDLFDLIVKVREGRPYTLAFAQERRGVFVYRDIDRPDLYDTYYDAALEVATDFMGEVTGAMRATQRASREIHYRDRPPVAL